MRYIFKILILGDPDTIEFYALRAFEDSGEDQGTFLEWYKEVRVLEDICDLEIDVLTSVSADLDGLLPMADGIIYFLNPLKKEESELFKMILPDIFSVKRDIPTVIIFYDQNGILSISVNDLLENIWVNYPSLEAFVNLPPRDFHQALQSLSLAMINGDTPLNIENAWMRFPIFIQMANIYYANKNYYYAAQAVKKAALIADIYNKEEFFIICEQAAYLYSKMNLYLEASNILENVDKIKARNYKNLYADAMIREGNLHFNRKDFENAAIQYERSALWASIESLDKTLIHDAFKLAINSWISACKVENAFKILDNLPHKLIISILKEVSEKIQAAADFLLDNNNFELATEQLYLAVKRYQLEGLFEELKDITRKLTKILIQIFKQFVSEGNLFAAKNIYDKVVDMWEYHNVEKSDLDSTLELLINGFLTANNFETASLLITKLNSRTLRQKLTKVRDKFEDDYSAQKKQALAAYIDKGIEVLREFFEAEMDIIIEMNKKKIEEAEELSKQGEFSKAAIHLKKQANYLKNIGKIEIRDQILTKSLDVLLQGINFEEFFKLFDELSDDMKTKYLTRVVPKYVQKLKELKNIDEYKRKEMILENSNRIFRTHMLYEENKDISLIFIDVIKEEALKILENEETQVGIKKATELVKKVSDISEAYLEKNERTKISNDKIYKKIAEIFIKLGDLPSANSYNDKIENKEYKSEIHKKVDKLETKIIESASKKAEESYREGIIKETYSIIKNKGSEARLDRERELKERKALKRVYYKEALKKIELQEFNESYELYKKSIIKLNKIQKYNLAGVSLALASFLLIIENRFDDIKNLLTESKNASSSLWRLLSETYPVELINYIIELKKFGDDKRLKEAIEDFESLPLFEEELVLLYNYLGKDYQKEKETIKIVKPEVDIKKTKIQIKSLAESIQKEKQDIAKRKLMKNKYWKQVLEGISEGKMTKASMGYLETIPQLIDKKFIKNAAISLILASLILYKERNLQFAVQTFEKYLKVHKSELELLPEIKIMDILFKAFKDNERRLSEYIINLLLEKLILFEPEVKILKIIIGDETTGDEDDTEGLSREQLGKYAKLQIEMDQRSGKIRSKLGDIRRDRDDILKKRKAMRRRYYTDIIELLKSKNIKEASVKYIELADTISKRKDLETSSLLILLYGLSSLKSGEKTKSVKNEISKYLNNLGINKKLVEETYYIMVILFIMDVKLNNIEKYRSKIKNMLEILPLLEEEKDLIDLEW